MFDCNVTNRESADVAWYRLRDSNKEKAVDFCKQKFGEMPAQLAVTVHFVPDGSGLQHVLVNEKPFRLPPSTASAMPYQAYSDATGRMVLSNGETMVCPVDLVSDGDVPKIPALPGLPGTQSSGNPTAWSEIPASAIQRFADRSHDVRNKHQPKSKACD